MEARKADDHRQCHHLLDWVPYSLAMRVSQRLECGSLAATPSRAHDPARVMPLTRLDTRMLGVLVTHGVGRQ